MSTNLTLRALEKTDVDFLYRLYNDPAIMKYWFEEPYFSKTKIEENLTKQLDDTQNRRFILQNGTEAVGFVALFFIHGVHRKAEFAIMMDPQQQGKGYAKTATKLAMDYAFQTLNLNKLYLVVDEVNEKAIHIYEKIGFKYEALLKNEYFIDGVYHNAVYMSIFQDEYLV